MVIRYVTINGPLTIAIQIWKNVFYAQERGIGVTDWCTYNNVIGKHGYYDNCYAGFIP